MNLKQMTYHAAGLLLLLITGAAQPALASSDDAVIPLNISPIDDVKATADSKSSVSLKLDPAEVRKSSIRVQDPDSLPTAYRMQKEDLIRADRVALGMLHWQDSPQLEDNEVTQSDDAAAASNPLSSASNIDLRLDYFDLGRKDRYDFNVRGGTMIHPRVKLAFEVHYWSTNITGRTEDDWERLVIRPIWFIKDAKLNDEWKMRLALGVEFGFDADSADQGIGSGSDQIAPLFGIAFNNSESNLTLIPLVQQFLSYDGPSVNITAFRLIALKPLPNAMWLRLDTKIPFDWENDTVPASFEVELGKMFEGGWGLYGTGFFGIGGDRLYDWGVGAGLRFTF